MILLVNEEDQIIDADRSWFIGRRYQSLIVEDTPDLHFKRLKVSDSMIAECYIEEAKFGTNRIICLNLELIDLQNKVQDLEDYLEKFVYIVSHDIQEPIRVIHTYLDKIDDEGKHAEDFDVIYENIEWIRKLIDGLLRYFRIGSLTDENININVTETLELVLHNLSLKIKEAKAKVKIDCQGAVIFANDILIHRVFLNLIENAIKYGGTEIVVSCRDLITSYEFVVKDNGMGIDKRYHKEIFFIFKRLAPKEQSGAGIGLAEVKRVVESYGGEVWLESQLGRGSTFYFTLPKGVSNVNVKEGEV